MSYPADTREAILSRLQVILKQITGLKQLPHGKGAAVFRNRLNINDDQLPAIAVLDGDEGPDVENPKGRPANGAVVMVMRPEIYGFLKEDDPAIGPEMSSLRAAILKTVLNDQTLLGLCKDGEIRYEGYTSGMAQGRSMEGEMAIGLAFVYVLRPKAL